MPIKDMLMKQARAIVNALRHRAHSEERGVALPELLVSAIVLALIAGATISSLIAIGTTSSQERFRAQAQAIAQADQVRVRAMKISDLGNNYSHTRTVRNGPTTFTVTSTAQFITEANPATTSCTENTSNTDYIKVQSSVTWGSIGTRPPVTLASLIAPPTGSTAPTRGSLQVSVTNAAGAPRSGVAISGTGPTNFSGTTASNGCIIFGNLPIGTYTVTPTLAGVVDPNGVAPAPQTVDVIAQSTTTVALQYDTPGRITATFRVRNYAGTVVSNQQATGIVVFNTGMQTARLFGTGTLATTQQTTTTLFPFTSPQAVYAGRCAANNPGSGAGIVSPTVAPGAVVAVSPAIQLFPLYLNVYMGSAASGAKSVGANVRIEDLDCPGVVYNFVTNSAGQLPLPGLPFSDYEVCVRGPSTSGTRRVAGRLGGGQEPHRHQPERRPRPRLDHLAVHMRRAGLHLLRSERGVSLPELLVSVIMGTVLIIAALTLLTVVNRSSARQVARVDANQRARPVMERIMDELRSTCVSRGVVPVLAGLECEARSASCTERHRRQPRAQQAPDHACRAAR